MCSHNYSFYLKLISDKTLRIKRPSCEVNFPKKHHLNNDFGKQIAKKKNNDDRLIRITYKFILIISLSFWSLIMRWQCDEDVFTNSNYNGARLSGARQIGEDQILNAQASREAQASRINTNFSNANFSGKCEFSEYEIY